LFGNGGLYSINYERCSQQNVCYRIGFSTFRAFDIWGPAEGGRIITVPVLIFWLSGRRSSHFEIGGGVLLGSKSENSQSNAIVDLTSFIGYRYQPYTKGLVFRLGLTPFVSLNGTNYPDKSLLSLGISLGYHF
jgi:hypothetical protein